MDSALWTKYITYFFTPWHFVVYMLRGSKLVLFFFFFSSFFFLLIFTVIGLDCVSEAGLGWSELIDFNTSASLTILTPRRAGLKFE